MGKARQRARVSNHLGECRPRQFSLEGLEARRLLSSTAIGLATQNSATPNAAAAAASEGIQGYSPAQVVSAYGFTSNVSTAGADGTGQTIALVEAYHSKTIVSDLQTFDQLFHLPGPPSIQQFNQYGGTQLPAVNNTWSQETALDVEWAHAIAPGAKIVIVEAKSDRLVDLLTAIDAARRINGVTVVSISWGVNEFASETSFDYLFTAPAEHSNITFVASSGEHATAGPLQWPATSPDVVSVGGSTLTLANADGITVDAPWTSTDSGNSQYEAAPPFQKSGGKRGVPDVVYDGNPTTGFAVYDSSNGGWVTLGGTSAGAPQWAALIAIADQIRATDGKASLDGSTQTLPQIYNYYSQPNSDVVTFTQSDGGTIAAGSLTGATGGQGAKVINHLAATTTAPAAAKSKPAAGTPGTKPPKVPPGVRGRPFVQLTLRLPPSSISVSAFARSEPSHADLRQVASSGLPLTSAVPDGSSLTPGGATSSPVSTAMLNGAFSAAAIVGSSRASALSEAFAGLFVAAPGIFGQADVVPVGAALSGPSSLSSNYYYIAHLNASTAFCDAVSAFINECAAGAPPVAIAEEPSHGHVRAWTITGAVAAIDVLILHHLVLRRRSHSQPRGRG